MCTVHFQCFAGCQNLIRGNFYATKGNYKSSGLKNAVSFTATINARKAITKVPNTNVNISWGAQKLNSIAFIFLCFISIFSEKKVQNGWKEVTENCWKKPCLYFPISNLFGRGLFMLALQLATAAPLLVLQIQMILTLVGKNL